MSAFIALIFAFFLTISIALAGAVFSSVPVMWLWNAFMPEVFGVRSLTWLQALWLCLLCALLLRTPPSARGSAE